MPSQNWDELEEKYEYGLNLNPEERAAWLEGLTVTHPEIAPVLTQLFVVNEPVDDFFSQTPGQRARLFESETDASAPEPEPQDETFPVIRNYKITQLIDRGGMGLVYRAEQESPVRREVALKIIQPHCVGNEEYWARFFAERDVLARLNHNAIAQIFDSGYAEDGRPYFSMELVEGQPIDSYCQEKALSLTKRLELFIQLGRGILHAHQKMVIHRDLKPANILVSHVLGRPVVKIIDFGISKQLTESQDQARPMTQIGNYMGTIPYLSPEQASGAGATTDSRTDLYALGVVLYEMLTGSWPFDGDALEDQPLDQRLRMIRQVDPIKPSKCLESNGSWLQQMATFSGKSTKQILTTFKQELDWILLKALEKEPDRRYDAVTAMIQDVEAFLDHQPIQARPPTLLYQAKKFYQRYKIITLAASSVFLAVIASLTAFAISNYKVMLANEREALARESQDLAFGYLDKTFRMGTPNRQGSDLTVQELVQRSLNNIEQDLPGQPVAKSYVLSVFGNHFRALGNYKQAEKLFRRAYDLRADELGKDNFYTLEALELIASLQSLLGQKRKSIEAFREIEKKLIDTKRTDSNLFAKTLYGLAKLTKETAKEDAYSKFNQVLDILAANPDFDQDLKPQAYFQLALMAKKDRRNQEAMDILESVIKQLEKGTDTQKPSLQLLFTRAYLGETLVQENKYEQGIPLIEASHKELQNRLSKYHLDYIAVSRLLGRSYSAKRRFAEAEAIFLETTQSLEETFGKKNPNFVDHTTNLARIFEKRDCLDEAISLLQGLTSLDTEFEQDHAELVGAALNNLGNYYKEKETYGAAQPVLNRALELKFEILGPDNKSTVYTIVTLAEVLFLEKNQHDSVTYAKTAKEIIQAHKLDLPDLYNFSDGIEALGLLKKNPEDASAKQNFQAAHAKLQTNKGYQRQLHKYYLHGVENYDFPELVP